MTGSGGAGGPRRAPGLPAWQRRMRGAAGGAEARLPQGGGRSESASCPTRPCMSPGASGPGRRSSPWW
eukprot:4141889-Lingulodinium_polyedra.AAC.1